MITTRVSFEGEECARDEVKEELENVEELEKICLIGSGIIGRNWAAMFATAGFRVVLYDKFDGQVEVALKEVETKKLELMHENDLLGGQTVQQVFRRISGTYDLDEAVKDAVYSQECCPENLEIRKAVFKELDEAFRRVGNLDCVMASSASNMFPSLYGSEIELKHNVLTAHPVNPPLGLPLVELIPAPFTKPEIVARAREIQTKIGQAPIVVKKEVAGFCMNRMQYALLAEAFRIVEDGIASPEDVDTAIKYGLGLRWSIIGPFEVIDTNAPEGVIDYCERYAEPLLEVVQKQDNSRHKGNWPKNIVEEIHEVMRKDVPMERMQERLQWRDNLLMKINKVKRENSWQK